MNGCIIASTIALSVSHTITYYHILSHIITCYRILSLLLQYIGIAKTNAALHLLRSKHSGTSSALRRDPHADIAWGSDRNWYKFQPENGWVATGAKCSSTFTAWSGEETWAWLLCCCHVLGANRPSLGVAVLTAKPLSCCWEMCINLTNKERCRASSVTFKAKQQRHQVPNQSFCSQESIVSSYQCTRLSIQGYLLLSQNRSLKEYGISTKVASHLPSCARFCWRIQMDSADPVNPWKAQDSPRTFFLSSASSGQWKTNALSRWSGYCRSLWQSGYALVWKFEIGLGLISGWWGFEFAKRLSSAHASLVIASLYDVPSQFPDRWIVKPELHTATVLQKSLAQGWCKQIICGWCSWPAFCVALLAIHVRVADNPNLPSQEVSRGDAQGTLFHGGSRTHPS